MFTKKLALCFLLLLLFQKSWAVELLKEEALQHCSQQIETLIQEETSNGSQLLLSDLWQKIPNLGDSIDAEFSYSLPETLDLTHLEIRVQSGSILIKQEKDHVQKSWRLDRLSCEINLIQEKPCVTEMILESELEFNSFTKEKLEELLSQSESGVIYIWSPHMLLSVIGIPHIEEICKQLNVHLTVIMDAAASPILVSDVKDVFQVKTSYTRANHADALGLMGSELHYPSLILYRKGELLPKVLFGAKSNTTYQKFIQANLK